MYKIGETVVYGANGICTITDIEEKKVEKELKKYYVLKPVYNKVTTLFVPLDSEVLVAKMNKVLSKEEIYELLDSLKNEELEWIDNEQERNRRYSEILRSGDRREIMKVIGSLYKHRQKLIESGRKFHIADEKIMKSAEAVLHEEFAYVLDIGKEKVLSFITDRLETC